MRSAYVLWGLCLLLVGCGASSERARVAVLIQQGNYAQAVGLAAAGNKHDARLLVAIAEELLAREASSTDPVQARAAFAELAGSGPGARAVLQTLSGSAQPIVRARALSTRMQLGDEAARSELAKLLTSADPELVDLAVAALSPLELEALLAALSSVRVERRLAALSVLRKAAPSDRVRSALVQTARLDPEPQARAAALSALVHEGSAAIETVAQALTDPEESVRIAATAVLAQLDLARAQQALEALLGAGAPSAQSIEAARLLLQHGSADVHARAWQALTLALDAADFAVRARAAVTLHGMTGMTRTTTEPAIRELARAQLRKERVPEIRLTLALLLGTKDADGRATLASLSELPTMTALQAAAELARQGDQNAVARLMHFLRSLSAALRSSAARAVARDLGRSYEVRDLLADREPTVRRAAAGAILSSAR